MSTGWTPVTHADPCPVCKKPDWCCVGRVAINCMRVPSTMPVKNGGWLHPLDASAQPVAPKVETPRPAINAAKLMRQFREHTTGAMIEDLAAKLGVQVGPVELLGVAWSDRYQAWAWPMRDAWGEIIGIRLRSDSRKWAVAGSRAGLFFVAEEISPLTCVLEGPTDTAAAMSIGLDAVGRPSCRGQEDLLCDRLRHARRVLIVADNDTPGISGAEYLQEKLRCPSLVWCPPCKDLREFVNLGGTKQALEAMIKGLTWNNPKQQ